MKMFKKAVLFLIKFFFGTDVSPHLQRGSPGFVKTIFNLLFQLLDIVLDLRAICLL